MEVTIQDIPPAVRKNYKTLPLRELNVSELRRVARNLKAVLHALRVKQTEDREVSKENIRELQHLLHRDRAAFDKMRAIIDQADMLREAYPNMQRDKQGEREFKIKLEMYDHVRKQL